MPTKRMRSKGPDLEIYTGRRYRARGVHSDALDTVRVLTVYADENPPYLYVWSEGQGSYGYLEIDRIVEEVAACDRMSWNRRN